LRLYQERYFDLSVRHFHEKLQAEHAIELSYTWVKQALQGAGLVQRRRRESGDRCRECCCTSMAARTAGSMMIAGTT